MCMTLKHHMRAEDVLALWLARALWAELHASDSCAPRQVQSERDTWREAALTAQQRLREQTGDAELNRAELAEQERRAAAAEAAVQLLRQQAEDQQEQLHKVLAPHVMLCSAMGAPRSNGLSDLTPAMCYFQTCRALAW